MIAAKLYFVNLLFHIIPPTRFWSLKNSLLRWAGADIDIDVRVVSSASIQMSGKLIIGKDSFIGHQVLIAGGGAEICIGQKVDIGPRVVIVTGSHKIDPLGQRVAGPGYSLPISIENGAWIGASSTILGGVRVGKNAIVAAGSVVTEDVPDRSMVAGVPSKIIKSLVHE